VDNRRSLEGMHLSHDKKKSKKKKKKKTTSWDLWERPAGPLALLLLPEMVAWFAG
jgi:hypothetical protein